MQGAIRLRFGRSRDEKAADRAGVDEASDAELAARAVADREAFAALYLRYVEPVYRYCYHRLGDHESAEDATSLVFTRALAGLPRYRERGSFRSWLFAIAHNVVTDLARRTRRTGANLSAPVPDDLIDPAPSPDDVVTAGLAADRLETALAALPDDQRRVLELRLSGLSSPEVARVLGRSPTAVRSLQFRAVERLRRLLAEDGASSGHEAEVHDGRR